MPFVSIFILLFCIFLKSPEWRAHALTFAILNLVDGLFEDCLSSISEFSHGLKIKPGEYWKYFGSVGVDNLLMPIYHGLDTSEDLQNAHSYGWFDH